MMADDSDNKIELKTFHCEIINAHSSLTKETDDYKDIPIIRNIDNSMVQSKELYLHLINIETLQQISLCRKIKILTYPMLK